MRLLQLETLQKMVHIFYILQDNQRSTYAYTIQTDIPGLFQNSLWLIRGNSNHKENKKKRDRDETNQYFGIFFSHDWLLIPTRQICR